MAWFKDLAGKAEDLLNQIDHNAAIAFQNEKKEKMNSLSPTWEAFHSGLNSELPQTEESYEEIDAPTIVVDSDSTTTGKFITTEPYENGVEEPNEPEIITITTNDALEYSTSVRNIDKEMFDDAISVKKVPTDLPQDEQNDQLTEALATTMHVWQQAEAEKAEREKLENSPVKSKSSLMADNAIFMRELENAKTDNELLQRRLAAVETDCNEYKDRVAYLQQQWDTMTKMQTPLRDVNEKMSFLEEILKNTQDIDWSHMQDSNSNSGVIRTNKTVQQLLEEYMQIKNEDKGPKEDKKLVNQLGLLHQLLEHFSHKLEVLSIAVKKTETERQEALQLEEIARRDAVVARQDFDQYKLRAQRILQDKERALAQLRGEISDINSGVTPADDTHYLELQALRHEHEVVCEEVLQLEARLQGMREELSEAERRLAIARDTERRLQEALESERRARQAAEDDCRAHVEELRAVREDLFVQQSTLTTKVRDREIELNKLRKQLSQRPVLPSSNDIESRLRNLTQALVQKQTAVETLTAERNAAQLQLEKLEHKHQELLTHIHRSPAGFVNLNDTDDAKAQVPSLFVESPFDTGVTRRVKRAYTTLDAVSIRTGVFLRRYPLARVLVFFYMILLHIWVMVVLFTYTPSAQGGQ